MLINVADLVSARAPISFGKLAEQDINGFNGQNSIRSVVAKFKILLACLRPVII